MNNDYGLLLKKLKARRDPEGIEERKLSKKSGWKDLFKRPDYAAEEEAERVAAGELPWYEAKAQGLAYWNPTDPDDYDTGNILYQIPAYDDDGNELPEPTEDELMAWVDSIREDKIRARAAEDAEEFYDYPKADDAEEQEAFIQKAIKELEAERAPNPGYTDEELAARYPEASAHYIDRLGSVYANQDWQHEDADAAAFDEFRNTGDEQALRDALSIVDEEEFEDYKRRDAEYKYRPTSKQSSLIHVLLGDDAGQIKKAEFAGKALGTIGGGALGAGAGGLLGLLLGGKLGYSKAHDEAPVEQTRGLIQGGAIGSLLGLGAGGLLGAYGGYKLGEDNDKRRKALRILEENLPEVHGQISDIVEEEEED